MRVRLLFLLSPFLYFWGPDIFRRARWIHTAPCRSWDTMWHTSLLHCARACSTYRHCVVCTSITRCAGTAPHIGAAPGTVFCDCAGCTHNTVLQIEICQFSTVVLQHWCAVPGGCFNMLECHNKIWVFEIVCLAALAPAGANHWLLLETTLMCHHELHFSNKSQPPFQNQVFDPAQSQHPLEKQKKIWFHLCSPFLLWGATRRTEWDVWSKCDHVLSFGKKQSNTENKQGNFQISLFQTDSVLLIMPLVALVDEDQPSGLFFHEFETTLDATLKIWMDDNLPAGAGRHGRNKKLHQVVFHHMVLGSVAMWACFNIWWRSNSLFVMPCNAECVSALQQCFQAFMQCRWNCPRMMTTFLHFTSGNLADQVSPKLQSNKLCLCVSNLSCTSFVLHFCSCRHVNVCMSMSPKQPWSSDVWFWTGCWPGGNHPLAHLNC